MTTNKTRANPELDRVLGEARKGLKALFLEAPPLVVNDLSKLVENAFTSLGGLPEGEFGWVAFHEPSGEWYWSDDRGTFDNAEYVVDIRPATSLERGIFRVLNKSTEILHLLEKITAIHDDTQPIKAMLVELSEDPHATDRQRAIAKLAYHALKE